MNAAMLAREIVNNGLFVLDVVLTIVIVRHLACEVQGRGVRRAYARLGNQAALALLVLMAGHILIRGWGAALLWHYRNGLNPWDIESRYPVALIGGAIAFVGMMCCVRIFSPAGRSNVVWIGSLVLAAAFIGVMWTV